MLSQVIKFRVPATSKTSRFSSVPTGLAQTTKYDASHSKTLENSHIHDTDSAAAIENEQTVSQADNHAAAVVWQTVRQADKHAAVQQTFTQAETTLIGDVAVAAAQMETAREVATVSHTAAVQQTVRQPETSDHTITAAALGEAATVGHTAVARNRVELRRATEGNRLSSGQEGVHKSKLDPKFLHSNSTSHSWPFGAIAELLDNAKDEDSKRVEIFDEICTGWPLYSDTTTSDEQRHLLIRNTSTTFGKDKDAKQALDSIVGFGISNKSGNRIGCFGNGFKAGTMKLGRDALVFARTDSSVGAALLSQVRLHTSSDRANA